MAEIRPFGGWRYDEARAGDLSSLIAPPYDIISPAEREALAARSPYNAIRLELTPPEPGDPPGIVGDAARHQRARTWLDQWSARGILRQDAPALYLYEQQFAHAGRTFARRTILAAVRLSPWSAGAILPHEHTLAGPKAERLALLRATDANLSPIWSLYEDPAGEISALLEDTWSHAPDAEATDDAGTRHVLRLLQDPVRLQRLHGMLAPRQFFIADGHHRYETALTYCTEGGPGREWVLMALTAVEDPGLAVLPTHRLLHGLDRTHVDGLTEALPGRFAVRDLAVPSSGQALAAVLDEHLGEAANGAHRFLLLGPGASWLRLLELREVRSAGAPPAPAVGKLDVWLAHAVIVQGLLGISAASVERQEHLTYTRDAAVALEEVRAGREQLALFLPPTPVSGLLEVARSGAVMPQKSTYFYPKLATGLVYRLLGRE